MKLWRRFTLYTFMVFSIFPEIPTPTQTREQREIVMAEKSILSSIAVSASPKGRFLCTSNPLACLGADKAELGLDLIGARGTSVSVAALARLVRFQLDGALGEDYECYLLKYGASSRGYLQKLKPEDLERECRSEVAGLAASDKESFVGLDASGVCASQGQMRQRIQESISAINAGRHCGAEDF